MPTQRPSHRRSRFVASFAIVAAAAVLAPATSAADHGVPDAAVPGGPVRASTNWALSGINPVQGRDALGLAVNPRNANHVVAVYADWATLWCETAVSFNGGRTWRRRRLKAPDGFVWPPCTVGAHLAGQLGGTIAFGRGRNVYTTFASARVGPGGAEHGKSVLVARSTNGGVSFGTGEIVMEGGTDADEGPDHSLPKLTVVPGRRGRADRIYLVASSTESNPSGPGENEHPRFTTSDDGGRTWTPPRAIDQQGNNLEVSQPVVGRGGRLYVAWRERGPGDRPGRFTPEGTVVVARSANGGRTWAYERVAGVRGFVYEGPLVAPFASVQSYTASTFPRLAADPRSDHVYLVYGNGGEPTVPGRARAADHFIHPDIDVWFQRSTDGGRRWSSPNRLNDVMDIPTEVTQTRHPSVSVARNGRVDVVWHDRRHWYRGCTHTHLPCLEARLGDTYYAFSEDGGESFSDDRRLTDRSINNDIGYDYRFGTYWDYGPVAAPMGRHRLLVGWMDSREGNFETDTQGIYLTRVTHRPSRRIPASLLRASTPSRLSVALSRAAYPAGLEAVLGGTFATRPGTRVVVVNEDDPDAALAAGVLARAHLATVLLSPAGGLPAHVKAELQRLAPVGAFVIGGERDLSARVVSDLAATGIPAADIKRIAGSNDADTARRIAEETDRRSVAAREEGHPAFDAALLVNPRTLDAYSAATLAAARRLPVLFAHGDTLPPETRQALDTLAIRKVIAVGEADVIGSGVLADLPRAQRLGGTTTLNTSRLVLTESRRRALAENVVFATRTPMDAALVGAAAARIGGLHLMAGRRAARVLDDLHMRYEVDRLVHVRGGGRG